MRHSDVNGGNTFCSPNLNENCSHSTKHFWPGNLFMRTMLQFGDVLLVISICLGRAPSLSTIKHQLMPFPQQIASTIIRPCLRQFSFKFCDHRSPPRPLIFLTQPHFVGSPSCMDTVKDIAIAQVHIAYKQNLAQAHAHNQDIALNTSKQARYCNKHSMFVEGECKSLPRLTKQRLRPAWLRSRELWVGRT